MNVILTGGGTAGHVNPAIAIGYGIKSKVGKTNLLYVGTHNGIEKEIVEKEKMEYRAITVDGMKSKNIIKVIRTGLKVLKGIFDSFVIIKQFKPDLIVGTGGYVSFPIVFVGQLLGIKTVIHEQNAFPGSANRKLSKKANLVFTSYKESHDKFEKSDNLIFAGNPIKREFYKMDREECRVKHEFSDEKLNIVSLGGSGGAKVINDIMFDMMSEFNGDERLSFTHITGRSYYEKYMKFRKDIETEFKENINILPFSYDIPSFFYAADIVICRAGALTIAELMVAGTPSIIIPSPNVKDNHQEYNARAIENAGRAFVILEKDVTFAKVKSMIDSFIENPKELKDMRVINELKKDAALTIIIDNINKIV
ncbi:MAG: undecaprenyldiphospho-muramoylpentapeptide beta-N-acetylglucosaminyltransferase [Acidaminobacteraceae bacterium]